MDSRSANPERCVHWLTTTSTIIDSRLGWTCEGGGVMNIGLGSDEEVAKWGEMELPDSGALRSKVAELESQGFRTNFIYLKLNMSGVENN